MFYSIVAILIIIIDQAVKLGVNNMILNGSENVKTLIPGVISLVRVQNDGAAFSFLAGGGARIWFIILTLVFVALVIIALVTNFISGRFGRWCMVIVAAGGLANCIDRVLYGYVLDMFRVDLFDFAVFNVADIFITVGCIAFIIYILFGGEKDFTPADRYEEEDDEEEDTPVRQPLFKKRKSYYEDDDDYEDEEDDDDDDDDDYEVAPRRTASRSPKAVATKKAEPVKKSAPSKRTTATSGEEKVARARAAANTDTAAKRNRNAEAEAQALEEFFKKRTDSKKPAQQQPQRQRTAPVTVERTPVRETYSEPVQQRRVSAPVEEPVQQRRVSEPVEQPVVTKPAATSSYDDFDLDSILNEFK